jgi:hypothetical protein
MSTALVRVTNALTILGSHSPIKKARAEVFNLTFDTLVSMLQLWNSQNIAAGFTIPDVIGDEMDEPPQIQFAIDYNLAVTVAPYLQKIATAETSAKAMQTMQAMRSQFGVQSSTIYPGTLPLGSGNTGPASGQTPIGPRFYPEPETIDSETGVPLII